MQTARLSFHSFNALRFFAFFKVFLLHAAPASSASFLNKLIFDGGEIGVDFFFVLSGFLITYLLAFEKQKAGLVDGKRYFLRRSLRIWPLFYLGVLIAYANIYISNKYSLGVAEGYSPHFIFSLTFLENYEMIYHDNFPNGAPLRVFWSICVEEHFYFLWLLLFKLVSFKHLSKALIILWLIGILYRIGFYLLLPQSHYYDFDVLSKMDYFCAGGLAGLQIAMHFDYVKQKINCIPGVLRNGFAWLVILFFLFHQFIPFSRTTDLYFPIISAAFFSGFILLIATTSTFFKVRESNIFSRLGKISYGMYVYHTILLVVGLAMIKGLGIQLTNRFIFIVFFLTAFFLTTAVSYFSFKYFETPFLRLKEKL
jgi:peptidoglycan/LPS O-acetylase OafA/YrhL